MQEHCSFGHLSSVVALFELSAIDAYRVTSYKVLLTGLSYDTDQCEGSGANRLLTWKCCCRDH